MKKTYGTKFLLLIAIAVGLFAGNASYCGNFESTLDLARKGDTVAIGEVAKMYCEGQGVQKNYQEALKWAEKGVAAGSSDAMYVMGYLYQYGGVVKADSKKAYDWYYKAAEQGNYVAMHAIGKMWHQKGTDPDVVEAAKWYVRSADFGYAPAKEDLSAINYRGFGGVGGSVKQYYDEEFDRTLEKNLAKQRKAKDEAKWAAIEGNGHAVKNMSVFDAAGFDISDKVKSNEGYLVISKVKSGSIAEGYGMLAGSDLYQIDNMNTKQCNAKEIRSYISKQQEAGATVLVIFMAEDGTPKRVDIKLR